MNFTWMSWGEGKVSLSKIKSINRFFHFLISHLMHDDNLNHKFHYHDYNQHRSLSVVSWWALGLENPVSFPGSAVRRSGKPQKCTNPSKSLTSTTSIARCTASKFPPFPHTLLAIKLQWKLLITDIMQLQVIFRYAAPRRAVLVREPGWKPHNLRCHEG